MDPGIVSELEQVYLRLERVENPSVELVIHCNIRGQCVFFLHFLEALVLVPFEDCR